MDLSKLFTFPLNRIIILIAALILDFVIGDPQFLLHPIILLGRWIKFLEKRLLRIESSRKRKRIYGFVLVLSASVVPAILLYLLIFLSFRVNPLLGNSVSAIIMYFMICNKGMVSHSRNVLAAIKDSDLERSRKEVGKIVGRDTSYLGFKGIIRATLESLAENTSDGMTGPLFFYLLGGVPGAFLYKAVNTLDSTVGYKNLKYEDFGFFSAKFDDILNYIPSRITAGMAGLLGFVTGGSIKNSFRTIRKYSRMHSSPNSGFPESAFAGALGLRFGGINQYFGKLKKSPYIGEKKKEFDAGDIERGIQLFIFIAVFFNLTVIIIYLFIFYAMEIL